MLRLTALDALLERPVERMLNVPVVLSIIVASGLFLSQAALPLAGSSSTAHCAVEPGTFRHEVRVSGPLPIHAWLRPVGVGSGGVVTGVEHWVQNVGSFSRWKT